MLVTNSISKSRTSRSWWAAQAWMTWEPCNVAPTSPRKRVSLCSDFGNETRELALYLRNHLGCPFRKTRRANFLNARPRLFPRKRSKLRRLILDVIQHRSNGSSTVFEQSLVAPVYPEISSMVGLLSRNCCTFAFDPTRSRCFISFVCNMKQGVLYSSRKRTFSLAQFIVLRDLLLQLSSHQIYLFIDHSLRLSFQSRPCITVSCQGALFSGDRNP